MPLHDNEFTEPRWPREQRGKLCAGADLAPLEAPYANEHSARINDPDKYDEFRRKNDEFGPGIHVIYGIRTVESERKTEVQSIRFDADRFTVAEAKAWLKEHDYKPIEFIPATKQANAEGQKTYRCECLDCGHVQESNEHCRNVRCEKCGGEMRRIERPGPGQRSAGQEAAQLAPSLSGSGVQVELKAAGVARVHGVAYTGGKMKLPGWRYPVVVDLEGLEIPETVPLLTNHENRTGSRVGVVRARIEDNSLVIEGEILSTSGQARGIVEPARAGADWQLSIGAEVLISELVRDERQVNGQIHAGPFYHVKKAVLREVSVLPVGADRQTSLRVAAAFVLEEEEEIMKFEDWLKEKGFDPEALTQEQQKSLKAMWEAEQRAADDVSDAAGGDTEDLEKTIEDLRAAHVAEIKRLKCIHELAKGHPDIEAKAIEEGWDETKTELEVQRATRPTGIHATQSDRSEVTPRVLEASLRLGGPEDSQLVEKAYDERVLEAAYQYRHIGLRDLIRICASLDGLAVPRPGAGATDFIEAAFSSASLSNLLGNTINRVLVSAYQAMPSVAKLVSKKLTANDFKEHTGWRMTGERTLEKVGPDGELKHATLNESQEYAYSVDTYGRMIVITRQMVVNDDVGAFTSLPQRYGQGAALTLEELFWTLVLDNTNDFFHADNSNLITNTLSSEGLSAAVKTLEEQTDEDGKPIIVTATDLVVPPALRAVADELYVSRNLVVGGGSSKNRQPNKNIHEGRYKPHSTPYLSNTTFHESASDTQWYLFGNPAVLPAFGIAYLNGKETPIVEQVSVPGNMLGRGIRVYFDIGVCQINPRGAVKSTGTG